MKTSVLKPVVFYILFLITVLLTREYIIQLLIKNKITSYISHSLIGILSNLVLILVSYYLIKKYQLSKMIGTMSFNWSHTRLLLFPLIYLPLINIVFIDEILQDQLFVNLLFLIIYSISIGLSEELGIRGFLQTFLLKHFGNTKKATVSIIVLSSLFFGIIHLIKFNKGLYGEISQVFFATFIGVLFGTLLCVTKRIYPLVIIHALIDFCAKLGGLGVPAKQGITEMTSPVNAIFAVIISLPYLIYALVVIKRHKLKVNSND